MPGRGVIMSKTFKMEVKGLKHIIKKLKTMDKEIKQNILGEFELLRQDVQDEAKRILLAGGHYRTGNLYRSIEGHLQRKYSGGKLSNVFVTVGSKLHYAIYMERYDPYLFPAVERYTPIIRERLSHII